MVSFSGGCLCGAVRYEVNGELIRTAICHCDDCRKATGAAFTTNIFVNEADLTIVSGTPKRYDHSTDSGSAMTKEFCADCGSQLFGYTSRSPGVKHIKVGTIVDASFVKPEMEVYTIRRLPYIAPHDGVPQYEKNRPR